MSTRERVVGLPHRWTGLLVVCLSGFGVGFAERDLTLIKRGSTVHVCATLLSLRGVLIASSIFLMTHHQGARFVSSGPTCYPLFISKLVLGAATGLPTPVRRLPSAAPTAGSDRNLPMAIGDFSKSAAHVDHANKSPILEDCAPTRRALGAVCIPCAEGNSSVGLSAADTSA
jgi:hypothetical protein